MDRRLLIAAALTAALTFTTAPAGAQHAVGIGIPNAKSPGMIGGQSMGVVNACRDGDRSVRRDRGRNVCNFVDDWAYADGEWALYNNRSWEPDSYNDWWHDRPDRAFPRWVTEQRMKGPGAPCDPDRMWWSGSGWHC